MKADRIRGDYHPGQLTGTPFSQDQEPPLAGREVQTKSRPVLYDHLERPIYRRIGFTLPQRSHQ